MFDTDSIETPLHPRALRRVFATGGIAWTAPAGVRSVQVQAWGGGGGGGSVQASLPFAVVPGNTYHFDVGGSGGAGGSGGGGGGGGHHCSGGSGSSGQGGGGGNVHYRIRTLP